MASRPIDDSALNFMFNSLLEFDSMQSGVPVFDLNSSGPLPDDLTQLDANPTAGLEASPTPPRESPPPAKEPAAPAKASADVSPPKPGALWLEGDVLMIGCPECRAPVSVRVWLMAADCWNCATSIELTEEQEREAQRLLSEQQRQPRGSNVQPTAKPVAAAAPMAPAPAKPAAASPVAKAPPSSPPPDRPSTAAAPRSSPPRESAAPAAAPAAKERPTPARAPQQAGGPAPAATATSTARASTARPAGANGAAASPARRTPAAAKPTRMQAKILQKAKTDVVRVWLSERLRETPAWLLSLLAHLVLLTLLGLFSIPPEQESRFITISTAVSRDVREGAETHEVDPLDELVFDLPLPKDQQETLTRDALVRADQDARELRVDDGDAQLLPPVDVVKTQLASSSVARRSLAARDPRVRTEVVKQEGGTTLTEAAVSRGLRWLANQQEADGRWKLNAGLRSDSGATSLALLPFLGAGQTHLAGRYRNNVAGGLRWLVQNQRENGDLAADAQGHSKMYSHGQSAIVLCEAFAMTGDEELRVPAQKAVQFILHAQHSRGGWRYNPGEAGDTSVLGWQIMALQSAKAANLSTTLNNGADPFELASLYLDSVSSRDGALYAYQPGRPPTHVMTAEALLCRMYLGWNKTDPGLIRGVEQLRRDHLPRRNDANMYYWYYATQVFHHVGGPAWDEWNLRIRDILVESQRTDGALAGSWDPGLDPHGGAGGRVYVTSLAVCTLEVYYRHAPIFRQLELE